MTHALLVPELLCSDLAASLSFYTELAGFEVLYDRPEDGFAYLSLAGAELMLEEAPEEFGDAEYWWTGAPEKPYGRGINLQIEVDDVDAICQRMQSRDWPLFKAMEERWYRMGDEHTGNREFLVQDPDGYLLRFFSDLGLR